MTLQFQFQFLFKIVNTQDTDTNSHGKPILGCQLQINIFNETYIYEIPIKESFQSSFDHSCRQILKPFSQFSTSSHLMLAMT
jgi:hypothetical protein